MSSLTILDNDLASLYKVPTKALNQAVRRNREKFPEDLLFQLTWEEAALLPSLRSQFVTLKRGRHLKYRPFAFTEHGALMAATVLSSPRAVAMSLYLIRAFVKMREDRAANAAILKWLGMGDESRVTQAIGRLKRKGWPELEPLKRRLEQVYENHNTEAEARICEFRDPDRVLI